MKSFRASHALTVLATTLALATPLAAQGTWYVDDDAPSDPSKGNPLVGDPLADGSPEHPFDRLDLAIAAASSGDTILVRPSNPEHSGLHYWWTSTIDLSGPGSAKALTLRSTDGPEVTVFEGVSDFLPDDIPLFQAIKGESPAYVIEGLTFLGADNGSSSGDSGGAFYVSDSSPTFRNCTFEDGNAYRGAAAFLNASTSLFEECTFTANHAVHQGGAIYSSSASPTFSRCSFQGNTANYGGAFLIRTATTSAPRILDCVFLQNEALLGYAGGLAKFDAGTVLVERTRFVNNTGATESGGLHVSGGGVVRDCLFHSNTAPVGGGMTAIGGGVCTVYGSTFANNSGGAAREATSTLRLRNGIVWGNFPDQLGAGVEATYTDVLGGYSGSGNIDVDPLFENPFGLDGLLGTLDDDYSLTADSPCIDAGNSTEVLPGGSYPLDLARLARAADRSDVPDTGIAILGLTVDMGCFEFHPRRDHPLPVRNRTVGN